MIRNYLLLLFFSYSFVVSAQDDNFSERRFFAGVNIGTKIANRNYAFRYAGWYQDELPNAIYNNPIVYNDIRLSLGDLDWILPFDYAPARPRYSPGLLTGILLGWKMTPELQVSVEGNFNRLKMQDVFSIEVLDPGNQTSQEIFRLGDIYAVESRFNGRFNIDYINPGEKASLILGIHGIFGAWRIDEQVYQFNNILVPIFSVHNPTNSIIKKVTGIGWGAGINLGVEYRFNEQIVAQLMYQPHHAQYDFDYEIPQRIRLQHDIMVRILWK